MDWSDRFYKLVNQFFEEVINPILPFARGVMSSAHSSSEVMPKTFQLIMSTTDMFYDSVYAVDRSLDYLHFTKLASIERILRDKVILASSISNFSDVDEVSYGMNSFTSLNPNEVKRAKDAAYVVSLVEETKSSKSNAFMWNVYGDLGKGGYLKFDIPSIKYPFTLGKVKYGSEELEGLNKLNKRIEAFKSKYSLAASEIEIIFIHLAACHKSKRFESEKEVRLIYSKDYEMFGGFQKLKTRNYVGRGGIIQTSLEVPVQILSKGESYVESPKTELLLKEIVLGYGVPDSELSNTLELLMENLPTNPQVKIWRLNKELEFNLLYSF